MNFVTANTIKFSGPAESLKGGRLFCLSLRDFAVSFWLVRLLVIYHRHMSTPTRRELYAGRGQPKDGGHICGEDCVHCNGFTNREYGCEERKDHLGRQCILGRLHC